MRRREVKAQRHAGEAVASAAGQDAHRGGCADDCIGDLVLRAIAAVAHHKIYATLDRFFGLVWADNTG